MTDEEKLKKLVERIEQVVPYVLATLPYPNVHVQHSPITTSDPDWVAIHKGRAASSYNQLKVLLEEAHSVKE